MNGLDKLNWGLAAVVVFLTIFSDGRVDGWTFAWLGVFLTCVYGVPLLHGSCLRRLEAERRRQESFREELTGKIRAMRQLTYFSRDSW